MYEVMALNVQGSVGGVAILLNPSKIFFDQWMSMPDIISGRFWHIGTRYWAIISTAYGPNIPGEKWAFLQMIRMLKKFFHEELWIVGGDFNIILSLEEKKGRERRQDLEMEVFQTFITYLKLVDIPTHNGIYMWNNRSGGHNQVSSHLNCFLVSEGLISRDIFFEATILPCMGSNHWQICLEMDMKLAPTNQPFRF